MYLYQESMIFEMKIKYSFKTITKKKKLADLQKLEEPSTQKCANPLLSAY